MSGPGDVAGWVRGRALLQRRAGPTTVRRLASSSSVVEAVRELATTPYGHAVTPGMGLAAAQRAVAATLLWHLRILAGWQGPNRSDQIRALAAGFEVANTVDLLLSMDGAARPTPFELGSLSTAWGTVRRAASPAGVRSALSRSRWGDPGSTDPAAVRLALEVAWAYRVWDEAPAAAPWAREAAGLMAAHLESTGGRAGIGAGPGRQLDRLLGRGRPRPGRPPGGPGEGWSGLWQRVAEQSERMAAADRPGPEATAAMVALLAVDAGRVRAALALAAAPAATVGWEDVLGAVV